MSRNAEDLVQEVLTRLLLYLRESEGNRTFSSIYLQKAAYGAMVDEIRRQKRRGEETVGDGAVLAATPDRVAGPDEVAAGRELGRGIRSCLETLGRARRLAVTLFLQGCTVPETARRLDWPMKKAENLVYRGLADLRACLRRKGMEP
jgi:RNA polymerase sigma-70 factor (ECF subfamily)